MEIFPAQISRQFYCKKCNIGFDNELILNNHLLTPCYKIVMVKNGKFYCNICDIDCRKNSDYIKHINTSKHKRKSICPKKGTFFCQICDIDFPNKRNLERHKMTSKHINLENGGKNGNNKKTEEFLCTQCNKEYSSHSGLWKHMQKCTQDLDPNPKPATESAIEPIKIKPKKNMADIFTPELVMLLIEQNKELQNIIMEQNKETKNIFMTQMEQNKAIIEIAKNSGNNNNNNNSNNTINNDNKSFNLNFFLNERCKNAMNLSDFVNGVDISLDDFEETGRIGYVEGLSRIFCKELQKLDIFERPIHCSDAKRETIYIRENNRWEKDENKEKLLRAVKQIGKKNIKVLTLWQEKYPGYKDVESKENDRYLHILTNIMCGETEEEIQSNYGKIMKNISRITVVDKH
jgi:hypothetical protein